MIFLLCAVYEKGYFIRWDGLIKNQIANRVNGATGDLVDQVVARLVAYGFFNEDLFNSAKVITSQRIQETYLEATKRRKQQEPTEYWINDDKNVSSTGVNADINPQSKVNESKVNKTKKDKQKKSTSQKRTYDSNSTEMNLATFLLEKIKDNNPEVKPPDLNKWANDIRLMIERDKRETKKVRKMIIWAESNQFWRGVVLSADSLRRNYDKMAAQANSEVRSGISREHLPDYDAQAASQAPSSSGQSIEELQRVLAAKKAKAQSEEGVIEDDQGQ